MAARKKKDDLSPRLLRQTLGWGSVDYTVGAPAESFDGGQWTNGSVGAAWQRATFDLSGYTAQEKTLFFTQLFSQRIVNPHFEITLGDAAFPPIHEVLLVSDTYWGDESIQAMLNQIGLNVPPGFVPSPTSTPYESPSWQSVLYGESIVYRGDSSLVYGTATGTGVTGIVTSSQTFGSGGATASDRVYVTRVISAAVAISLEPTTPTNPTGVLYIHPLNVVIAGLVGEEPDLEYIERLRRSYATEPTA